MELQLIKDLFIERDYIKCEALLLSHLKYSNDHEFIHLLGCVYKNTNKVEKSIILFNNAIAQSQ